MASSEMTEQTPLKNSSSAERVIVVAMDGSEQSCFALTWFKNNFYRPGDKVVVVYSVEMSQSLQSTNFLESDVDKDIKPIIAEEKKKHLEKVDRLNNKLKEEGIEGGEVKCIHAKKPGEGVVNTAKQLGAKLIVTGTRDLGALRSAVMGSVSDYILHHATVPVAVCRK